MANVIDKVAGLVVGPQGPQGPQGPKGDTGQTGPQGTTGATGATPNLTMGTVTTLEPDSPATATITGTAENPVLNLGLPKGRTGEVSQAEFNEVAEDVSQLMSEFTALAPKEDVLKAFPTDTASGAIASFTDGAELPLKSLVVDIEPVQDGTGDPSPDNVRPISGHTQAVVTRTGVNVWDEEYQFGYWNVTDGSHRNSIGELCSKNPISVVPGTLYYYKRASGASGDVLFYTSENEYIGNIQVIGNRTFTVPENCAYIRINFGNDYGTTYNYDIGINYPSTDHDYHPYSGQTITIALGQTVYGGNLDVTNGVLTVDRAMVAFVGTESYRLYGTTIVCLKGLTPIGDDNRRSSILCNYQKGGNGGCVFATAGASTIQWADALNVFNVSDIEEFKTLLAQYNEDGNPMTVVYPLATPITITLTPHEVTALLGSNNIWSDAGEVTAEYRADPTLFIQRKIAEAISALS